MIDKTSSVPLYQQIQSALLDGIRSGEYPPGSQILSELEIAARYEVSRMTARKAIDTLVSKGVLYRQRGKGTYVAENVVSYGLSSMLSFSQTLKAQGYAVETKVLMKEVLPAPFDVVTHLQLDNNAPIIVIRRLRHVEGVPAAIHASYFDQRMFAPLMKIDLSVESLLDAVQQMSGVRVAYSTEAVQADIATNEEARLLTIQENAPVLRVEGVAYSENGQPTRFIRAVYRGDMFRLMVKNTAEMATTFRVTDVT